MANQEHLQLIDRGVDVWNDWRRAHPDVQPDLAQADLSGSSSYDSDRERSIFFLERYTLVAKLPGRDLRCFNLSGADLSGANLSKANLRKADLRRANLGGANLIAADLTEADLSDALLRGPSLSVGFLSSHGKGKLEFSHFPDSAKVIDVKLCRAILRRADLSGVPLIQTDLSGSDLRDAILNDSSLLKCTVIGADLRRCNLRGANILASDLSSVDLRGAILQRATLVQTLLSGAQLGGASVYGIAAWDLTLAGARQEDLLVSPEGEPPITVDYLEIAQFLYLVLTNEKLRDIIYTIGRKTVLILGRFTPERKPVLNALREELRRHDLIPILFDFEKPSSRNLTETVSTLAHLALFVIADLTDAKSIPQELQRIVPDLPSVPVQPVILSSQYEYSMFKDFLDYSWVLMPHRYDTPTDLIASLHERIIVPATAKADEIAARRRAVDDGVRAEARGV